MIKRGVDYSFSKPGGAALKRAGVVAAGRYLGGQTKGLWNAEIRDVRDNNGVLLWVVYEPGDPGQMSKGYNQGITDARAAQSILNVLDLPSDLPIYSACDFDAAGGGLVNQVMEYQRGWCETLGYARSGMYGGGVPLLKAWLLGLAKFRWQAAGWAGTVSTVPAPGGRKRLEGIDIYQQYGGVIVPGTDNCEIYTDSYGQIGASNNTISTPTTPDEEIDVTAAEEINKKLDQLLKVFGNFLSTPDEEQGFIELLNRAYQNGLARDADPSALAGYLPLLKSGAIDEAGIAKNIVASDEYRRRYIWVQYGQKLGRNPSDADVKFWAGSNLTLEQIGTAIGSSDEAKQHTASNQ